MNDLISRQAAIEAMRKAKDKSEAHRMLVQLPSAQPDVPDTNVGDMISRQAAISEIMKDIEDRSLHDDPATPEDYAEGYDEGIRNAAAIVLQMPSAQPVEDARAMCGECDAWNKYKNYPQPEQFNPCTVCQEFDCTGCKFRRT